MGGLRFCGFADLFLFFFYVYTSNITPTPQTNSNGTQVLISRLDPLKEEPEPLKGSVVSYSSLQLNVCFEERCNIEDGVWRRVAS